MAAYCGEQMRKMMRTWRSSTIEWNTAMMGRQYHEWHIAIQWTAELRLVDETTSIAADFFHPIKKS